jgi:MauM/NapG family ferredoxin protein
LGLLSKTNVSRIRVDENCTGCGLCKKVCKMDAILNTPDEGKESILNYDSKECVWCMNCRDKCPTNSIYMGLSFIPSKSGSQTDLNRRRLLVSAGAGAVIAPLYGMNLTRKFPEVSQLRPPGSKPEDEFLDRCVRCGECMKVCIKNALQPIGFESGLEGLLTPRLETRSSYCEHNCNLCGQVCPTGAIKYMSLAQKQQVSMGLAYIDKNRCIPFVQGYDCLVCEEHCPTSDKAIIVEPGIVKSADGRERVVKLIRVLEERCVGCGICENKCPVNGTAAIRIIPRNPQLKLSEVQAKVRARQMGIGSSGYGH